MIILGRKKYFLKVKSLEKSKYELLIRKIYINKDVWEENREIIEEQPENQINSYLISILYELTPTLIPTITLLPNPALLPTLTLTITPTFNNDNLVSQNSIASIVNNLNNQNKKIILTITPISTMIIYSF